MDLSKKQKGRGMRLLCNILPFGRYRCVFAAFLFAADLPPYLGGKSGSAGISHGGSGRNGARHHL